MCGMYDYSTSPGVDFHVDQKNGAGKILKI